MSKEKRQQVIFGVLMAMLLIVVGRAIVGFLSRGDGGTAVTGAEAGTAGGSVAAIQRLRIAELELQPETYQLGRDPFSFFTPAPPKEPKPVRKPAPKAQKRRPAPSPNQGKPAVPQPPPVDVVYLGRFGATARPIAVFSDGNEIFNAFEGGLLKGNFVVDKIGYESADLKFVGFPDAPAKRLAVGG